MAGPLAGLSHEILQPNFLLGDASQQLGRGRSLARWTMGWPPRLAAVGGIGRRFGDPPERWAGLKRDRNEDDLAAGAMMAEILSHRRHTRSKAPPQ
jgi:hypothetical protein